MRYLSGKEKKVLSGKLPKGYNVDKKDEITQTSSILYKNSNSFLIIKNDIFLPHLKSVDENSYKSVYVDKGAIPFLLKGADMMRPGITKIEEGFIKGDIVIIKDENHNKNLGLGFALFNSEEMRKQDKGKSVEVYHYVSDEYY